jgi:hypothetical protein
VFQTQKYAGIDDSFKEIKKLELLQRLGTFPVTSVSKSSSGKSFKSLQIDCTSPRIPSSSSSGQDVSASLVISLTVFR